VFDIGLPELALILVAFCILFGAKRIGALGKAIGGTFKAFKAGLKDDDKKEDKKD
jgi:TatA/E family protein of Tat protein translocase